MKSNLLVVKNKIKLVGYYVPFTLYFVLFLAGALLVGRLLGNNEIKADSSFSDIFTLLIKVAAWFSVIIIAVAFLTVFISSLYFFSRKRKGGVSFKVETDAKETELHQKQTVRLKIKPVLKPIFGFIKIRLLYDKEHISSKFSLLETSRRNFFSNTVEGTYHWHLPQIKEYNVEKAILNFEDFKKFFSIAISLPASSNFFTQPSVKDFKELKISPRKTEETNTRIEQLRKVEGEYLNYKNFENNDDVRRIVWKIYAKNKELVVRIPEIMDPYASHVYLYSSFFNSFDTEGNPAVEIAFLNYFKTVNWSLYQSLVKQGFDVRYIPDQEITKSRSSDEQQWVKYNISTSKWQRDRDLKSFVKTSDASVVVISSLSNVQEVQELTDKHGREITFILVKLTEAFRNQNMVDWVQWLFIQKEKDQVEAYKTAWAISALRGRIKENERQLEELVRKAELLQV
jgi:hypothetical protein